ncbi:5'-nucleotidase C-terminal domain-containing protein [Actinomyces sp. ZJ308]|uniref:bifunctional metallophosphatase/5'-nucleotidase n=1 Tax=Actinomyces sp. ZJ308 TaxID=2708342 RepID=UPI003262F76A
MAALTPVGGSVVAVPAASLTAPAAAVEKPPDNPEEAEEPEESEGPGDTVRIKLVSIADLHGHYYATTGYNPDTDDYDGPKDPGLDRIDCAVSGIREDFPNTLFVSTGGNIGASPYTSSFVQDLPVMRGLTVMGLDVSALGVHDLEGGLKDLEERVLPTVDFPVLAANVSGSASLSAEGNGNGVYIKEVDGVRVGFIGVVTDDLPGLVSSSTREQLTVAPAVATANARAAELKDGDPANGEADVVVVLSHEDAASTATRFSRNVDAVVGGRSGREYGQPVTGVEGNIIPVVQPGRYGRSFGDMLLEFNRTTGETSAYYASTTPVESYDCFQGTPGLEDITRGNWGTIDAVAKQPLAHIGADFLRGSDGSVLDTNTGAESTAADLVAESYRSWVADIKPPGADHYVGLVKANDIKDDLTYLESGSYEDLKRPDQDGLVSYGEALAVQPDNKELAYTTLTGAELKALVAQQWRPQAGPSVLNLGLSSNVDVIVDPGATAERGTVPAIRELRVDGRVLADSDTVVVASTRELLYDGVDFTVPDEKVIVDVGSLQHHVFISYLRSLGDEPVMPAYSKRQVGMSATPKPDQAGTVTVTMDSLAYTNASERGLGAQRVRALSGGKEFFSQSIDLTVDRTGPTTGKASFDLTIPTDAPTTTCRAVTAENCRWVALESVDASGTVLNSFYVEVPATEQPTEQSTEQPTATPSATRGPQSAPSATGATASAGPSTAPSAPAPGGEDSRQPAGDGAGDGHAGESPSAIPAGGVPAHPEGSVGVGGLPPTASGRGAGAPDARGGADGKPVGGSGGWPLARTGASLSAGIIALALTTGGYLILRRRRREG